MYASFPISEDIKDACVLDAVLCVVDTKHVTQHLDDVKPDGVINEAGECHFGIMTTDFLTPLLYTLRLNSALLLHSPADRLC